jgi:hypothetical protein
MIFRFLQNLARAKYFTKERGYLVLGKVDFFMNNIHSLSFRYRVWWTFVFQLCKSIKLRFHSFNRPSFGNGRQRSR